MGFKIYPKYLKNVSKLGTGAYTATQSGPTVLSKGLLAGPNIMLTETNETITITGSGGGGGFTGMITTITGVFTPLITISSSNNTSYVLSVKITGSNTISGGSNNFIIQGSYKNLGGVLSKIASPDDKLSEKQDVLTDARLSLSGTNMLIEVRGIAGQSINWVGECQLQSSSF